MNEKPLDTIAVEWLSRLAAILSAAAVPVVRSHQPNPDRP